MERPSVGGAFAIQTGRETTVGEEVSAAQQKLAEMFKESAHKARGKTRFHQLSLLLQDFVEFSANEGLNMPDTIVEMTGDVFDSTSMEESSDEEGAQQEEDEPGYVVYGVVFRGSSISTVRREDPSSSPTGAASSFIFIHDGPRRMVVLRS